MNNFSQLNGSIVALVTPFDQEGNPDFERLGQLIDWHLENGTDGIVTLGTTGESATMTQEEDDEVCRFTVERVGGRIPVIAGSGSNCTQAMLERSLKFQELGADGLLLISPYYIKANEEGMYRHFADIADRVDIPCLLYNVPGRTGCNIPVGVVERLSRHPRICGIKEASGDMSYAVKIARLLSDDFVMYCGNDDITVPLLSIGARGVISVLANILPSETHQMVTAYLEGDADTASRMQLAYLELINNLFTEVNPIPVKTALDLMGRCSAQMRMPLYAMSEGARQNLAGSMRRVGLL